VEIFEFLLKIFIVLIKLQFQVSKKILSRFITKEVIEIITKNPNQFQFDSLKN